MIMKTINRVFTVICCICIVVLFCCKIISLAAVKNDSVATPLDVSTEEITNEPLSTEVTTEITTEVTTETTEEKLNDVVVSTDTDAVEKSIDEGAQYFLQKYLYDSNIVYLESYLKYMDIQLTAYEKMYEQGEITEIVITKLKAQKSLIEAELDVAKNESLYYGLIIEKEGINCDCDIKTIKEVKDINYYIDNYPSVNYMTIGRYVTDYHNAVAKIKAKELEISAMSKELELAELLYQQGEISKLDYAELEASLSFAQFELEKLYVDMNTAYYGIQYLLD